MQAFWLALLIAGCAGVWIFTKLNQKTGYGNGGGAIKGAIVAAAVIFLVVFSIGWFVFNR